MWSEYSKRFRGGGPVIRHALNHPTIRGQSTIRSGVDSMYLHGDECLIEKKKVATSEHHSGTCMICNGVTHERGTKSAVSSRGTNRLGGWICPQEGVIHRDIKPPPTFMVMRSGKSLLTRLWAGVPEVPEAHRIRWQCHLCRAGAGCQSAQGRCPE